MSSFERSAPRPFFCKSPKDTFASCTFSQAKAQSNLSSASSQTVLTCAVPVCPFSRLYLIINEVAPCLFLLVDADWNALIVRQIPCLSHPLVHTFFFAPNAKVLHLLSFSAIPDSFSLKSGQPVRAPHAASHSSHTERTSTDAKATEFSARSPFDRPYRDREHNLHA